MSSSFSGSGAAVASDGQAVAVSRTNGASSGTVASAFPTPSTWASSVSNWASRVASVRSILDLLCSGANPVLGEYASQGKDLVNIPLELQSQCPRLTRRGRPQCGTATWSVDGSAREPAQTQP